MFVSMGTTLIADNVKCVGVRRGRPCICFRQNLLECSSYLKSAGVIDDHFSLLDTALGMTTVVKTIMGIDGLSDNGDIQRKKNFVARSLRSRFFRLFLAFMN